MSPMPDDYLDYQLRRRGNDHDWFPYLTMRSRVPVEWPAGVPLALSVSLHFEHFPLDIPSQPVQVQGTFYMPGGSFLAYTTGDYGNRVGAYRLFRLLDKHGIRGTAFFNAEVACRYPRLVAEMMDRGWEIGASGVDMGKLLHGNLPIAEERAIIRQSLATLFACAGKPIRGWHSPGRSISPNSFALLAEEGVDYVTDWINDDMPYRMETTGGAIYSFPLADQWADDTLLLAQHQPIEEFERQTLAAHRLLKDEGARQGGRILSIPFHPRAAGQPYMASGVDRVLGDIVKDGGVWIATISEILASYRAQSGD